jgi:endonuclease-3
MEKNIEKIMELLKKEYSESRRTTLNRMREKPDSFKVLISCLISLRTRDENTEKVTKKLFSEATTPEQILNMPVEKLEKLIYSSGHYKKKSRVLKEVSKTLLEKYSGKVPEKEEELLSIKGVGRKTANVVRCFAFNKNAIPVDANVHRLVNRFPWVETKDADKTEEELRKILPKKYWKEINALFILHGRTVCVPISPFCSRCVVSDYCKKAGVLKTR